MCSLPRRKPTLVQSTLNVDHRLSPPWSKFGPRFSLPQPLSAPIIATWQESQLCSGASQSHSLLLRYCWRCRWWHRRGHRLIPSAFHRRDHPAHHWNQKALRHVRGSRQFRRNRLSPSGAVTERSAERFRTRRVQTADGLPERAQGLRCWSDHSAGMWRCWRSRKHAMADRSGSKD